MPTTKRISPKVGNTVEVLLPGDKEWTIHKVLKLARTGFWIEYTREASLFYTFVEGGWRWPHKTAAPTTQRTLQDLAKEALAVQVQDTCNLSGVVHSFDRAMTDLRAVLPEASTDELNCHPITRAWISNLADLAQLPRNQTDVWRAVERLAAGETP